MGNEKLYLCIKMCLIIFCISVISIQLIKSVFQYMLKGKEYDYLLTQETVKNKLCEHNYKEKLSFNMDKFNSSVENKIKELEDLVKKKESNYDTINQKLDTLITDSIIKE